VTRKDVIEVARDDVLAAWTILENLAVSFDHIGAGFGGAEDSIDSPEQQGTLQGALAAYLTPALVQAINEARIRLGQYISSEEAEALAEHIAYWDYVTLPKERE
jgi:hypothetical protein